MNEHTQGSTGGARGAGSVGDGGANVGGPPLTPSAPPIRPGAMTPPPPNWPMVVGIISIILGLGGFMTYGVCGLGWIILADVFVDFFSSFPGAEASIESMDRMMEWMWLMLPVQGVLGLLAVLLTIGGFGMVLRKPWARKVMLGWAIGKLIMAVPQTVVSYVSQMVQHEAMREDPAMGGVAGFGLVMEIVAIVSVAFGVLWAIAWPLFMLWWLNRATVRQYMAGWGASKA